MPDIAEVWKEALPKVKQGVTGVGVWTALNSAVPIAFEDGVLVLGLPYEHGGLAGHLRDPKTTRLIEKIVGELIAGPVKARIIEGPSREDWERTKRRDLEAQRLQQQAIEKETAKQQARTSWEGTYETLGRKFAELANKSLPQNRATYLAESVTLLAQVRKEHGPGDDLNERNFARCIERVAQFCEVPSALVAQQVLEESGEI